MLKRFLIIAALMISLPGFATHEGLDADSALLKLKEGNKRFTTNHLSHPEQTEKRRHELEGAQHPFVVVVSCSDSRVPPEIIFDQGLGDIFEIRNAGNVVDKHVLGSVEYAVEHLGVKLIVVMGHQNCGAIKAAIEGGKNSKNISSIVCSIKPALESAKKQKGDLVLNTTNKNVLNTVEEIKKCTPNAKVIPAYYHLDSGVVDFN